MSTAQKWLVRLDGIIARNLGDPAFNNGKLAEEIAVSERQLFRKVRQLTGLSPQKYLRRSRLKLAMYYMENGTYRTVKETAHAVGYINISYFIRQFEREFGRKPLRVLQEAGWR